MPRRKSKAEAATNQTTRPKVANTKMEFYQLPTPATDKHAYTVYDGQLSRLRLEVQGFSSSVTAMSPDFIVEQWHRKAEEYLKRRTREEYLAGDSYPNKGVYSYGGVLAPLEEDEVTLGTPPSDLRASFFGCMPYGVNIAEELASDGYKSLENLAVADPTGWAAMSTAIDIYNVTEQSFRNPPKEAVFLAINPEYTVFHMRTSPRTDGGHREKAAQDHVIAVMTQIHQLGGPTTPFWGPSQINGPSVVLVNEAVTLLEKFYDEKTIALVRSLPHLEGIEGMVDDLEPCKLAINRPYAQAALNDMHMLATAIYARRTKIRVLHFCNTPMLDCRMVAIILRSCPEVTMLGIYDCPMIGFGDVITLLDLIHEINQNRQADKKCTITKFDFFPHFNYGMPYAAKNSATYGITWSGLNGEVCQRGIFRVLLEAYLKAMQMGIGLLFQEYKAFRTYLSQLPLLPLAVECFLDGVNRYCQTEHLDSVHGKHEALYDALKAVRLGLEDIRRDWPDWYGCTMAKHLVFCSACGYDMPEEFFTNTARAARPHTRVCAGCVLRRTIETEDHHQKPEWFSIMTTLFDNWKGSDFNCDAPLLSTGRGLLELRTSETVRPAPPGMQMNAQGTLFQPQFEHAFVRDNKHSRDSLQSLPSLRQFVSRRLADQRSRAMVKAVISDIGRVSTQLLSEFYSKPTGSLPALGKIRIDRGKPNHDDEGQGPPVGPIYFGFENAVAIYKPVEEMGF